LDLFILLGLQTDETELHILKGLERVFSESAPKKALSGAAAHVLVAKCRSRSTKRTIL
jgi:hypothetical protein